MSETIMLELEEKHFGVFYPYLMQENVTDIDYNGRNIWVTDLEKGRYLAPETAEERFITQFIHDIANAMNRPFNQANQVLEADTRQLRISIVHASAAVSGTSICIRKSPATVRNTAEELLESGYVCAPVLNLLIHCVQAKMNFVFGGTPGVGKTECAKFFMQYIPANERVITIEDSLELHYGAIRPDSDYVEMRVGGGFGYTEAIKACLRQNPQWLMLSEARSVEVRFLLEQWSTGVNGFSTIHVRDIRELPDRLLNMMGGQADAERLENRVYEFVNIGILIRCVRKPDGKLFRYMDQVCFFTREKGKNEICMLVDDGKLLTKKLPAEIEKQLARAGIRDPFAWESDKTQERRKNAYENEKSTCAASAQS